MHYPWSKFANSNIKRIERMLIICPIGCLVRTIGRDRNEHTQNMQTRKS